MGDEETAIGKKIGEEEKRRDERVTWDGHTSSVEAATRAARAHITLEDQIQQIHKVCLDAVSFIRFIKEYIKTLIRINMDNVDFFFVY